MNELFDSLFGTLMDSATADTACTSYLSAPRVDVIEGDNNYTLEMELPGRSENDVNIELNHDNLTIASKAEDKKDEKGKKNEKYLLRERRACNFSRRFTLPQDVDQDSITANFKNGVLTVSMQKKAIAAPKRIAIEAC